MTELQLVLERLERIESAVTALADRQRIQEWYTTSEFAAIVGRSEFTVREYCRHGRINAKKRTAGRGAHCAWVISHDELKRFQRDGLLTVKHDA